MKIGSICENKNNEKRISITPEISKKYISSGFEVLIEKNIADHIGISDDDFIKEGCKIESKENILKSCDILLQLNLPNKENFQSFKEKNILIGNFNTNVNSDLLENLKKKSSIFSLELLPRITRAQSMDILSSQANLAGYKSVIDSFALFRKAIPMMMTAAGTIPASKVLVVGAGVAGLQAIATAKRLGAQVEAFDVRPVVKEQVESLGAKFVEVPSDDDDGVGEGGYAKETSDEYKRKQAELIKEHIAKSDLVVTTALIPGRPAPKIITAEMVSGMHAGSAIIDLASENGGNCELTDPGNVIEKDGVIIDGSFNIPSTMPAHASQVYAKNVSALINYICPDGSLKLDMEDEITSGSMFTHNGEVTNEQTAKALKGDS